MPTTPTEISFEVDQVPLRAGFWRPQTSALADAQGRLPCIVMAHGLGGTRSAGLEPFAAHFAAAGLAVLWFDYRGFGSSAGEPRQVVSVPMQLADWAAAIAHARTLDGIDPQRIATWGSSFSGAHAVTAAVRDGQIAAVSAQGAMMDGLAALQNLIRQCGLRHALRLSAAGTADALAAALGRPRVLRPIVGPPGSDAVLNTADAEPGYRAITPADWRNEISTSWALTLASYRPNTLTPKLPCPALFCIATEDVIVPPRAMEDGASRAPDKVQVRRYPAGHFAVYVPPLFATVVADQTAFFASTLAPSA